MKNKRWLWAMWVVSACGDSQRIGEKSTLRFQFGLFGCETIDARGVRVATGATTALVVSELDSIPRGTLVVGSDSPEKMGVSVTTDGGAGGAPVTMVMRCSNVTDKGLCSREEGAVFLKPVAAGAARITFTGSSGLVDAVTMTAVTPTSMSLRDFKTRQGPTLSYSLAAGADATLQAVLKDAAGHELAATSPFAFTAAGPLALSGLAVQLASTMAADDPAPTHQSGIAVHFLDAGTGSVTATFGALSATANVTVTP